MKNTLNPKIQMIKINNNKDKHPDQLLDQHPEILLDQPLEQPLEQPPEQLLNQHPNYLKNNKLSINMVNSEPTLT